MLIRYIVHGRPQNIYPASPVSFKVKNLTSNKYIPFAYRKSGLISTTHQIHFKENVQNNIKRTWRVVVSYPAANVSPIEGDTLTLITSKGFSIFDTLKVESFILNVGSEQNLLSDYYLSQNYPNPFNSMTQINFSLPKTSKVIINIYNMLGEKVAELLNEEKVAGKYRIEFDASKYSSGVYFYQFNTGDYIKTKKMILLH